MADPLKKRLWLPPSLRQDEPGYRCLIPTGLDGEVCGEPFFTEVQFKAHVKRCLSRNEEAVMRGRLSERLPGVYGDDGEAGEVERWLDSEDAGGRSNRDKVIDGRKRLGSERAQRPD